MRLQSRRARWLAGIALFLLASLAGLGWMGRRRVYRTVAGAEAALDSAGIVAGAPASRVLVLLDSIGAPHSALGPDRVVRARLGRSFEEFLVRGDLFVQLHFDSAGRLVSRSVREVLTGP